MPPLVIGEDLLTTFRRALTVATAAFARRGAEEAIIHHPVGDITGAVFLYFRTTDNIIHAWDLARAIGESEDLDAEVIAYCLEATRPIAAGLHATGLVGPIVKTPPGADRLVELLGLYGRRF